jgi:hypothetical protein
MGGLLSIALSKYGVLTAVTSAAIVDELTFFRISETAALYFLVHSITPTVHLAQKYTLWTLLVCAIVTLLTFMIMPTSWISLYQAIVYAAGPVYMIAEGILIMELSVTASKWINRVLYHDGEGAPGPAPGQQRVVLSDGLKSVLQIVVIGVCIICLLLSCMMLLRTWSIMPMQAGIVALILFVFIAATVLTPSGIILDPAILSLLVTHCLYSIATNSPFALFVFGDVPADELNAAASAASASAASASSQPLLDTVDASDAAILRFIRRYSYVPSFIEPYISQLNVTDHILQLPLANVIDIALYAALSLILIECGILLAQSYQNTTDQSDASDDVDDGASVKVISLSAEIHTPSLVNLIMLLIGTHLLCGVCGHSFGPMASVLSSLLNYSDSDADSYAANAHINVAIFSRWIEIITSFLVYAYYLFSVHGSDDDNDEDD